MLPVIGRPLFGILGAAAGLRVATGEVPLATIKAYALDLRLTGGDVLLDFFAAGKPLPKLPAPDALGGEVERALDGWDDDSELEKSGLRALGALLHPAEPPAQSVRAVVTAALDEAVRSGAASDADAQAVRLAYFEGSPKLEAAARRLAVSRPTFYRMRKRALQAIVSTLVTQVRESVPVGG